MGRSRICCQRYPRHVKFIRITIQDWYGNTFLEDMRDDFIYQQAGLQQAGMHYDRYSAVAPHAFDIVCRGDKGNIGSFLKDPLMEYDGLRAEWILWGERTIQSIWKGIYIPPFLFFGNN
jgi:hypothetical protein